MIAVANTRVLEERYDLSKIPDDEQVRIYGGMAGKQKYNDARYQSRITYTGREIKQIISQMKVIENSIPREWNQFQRAKYIYELLGKNIEYGLNGQRTSNLIGILDRKAQCSGYSLLYKEMMDRQGIECDYIRGIGYSPDRTKSGKHAWNVLTINGQSFPVELTWDSLNLRKGEKQLQFFGVDDKFFERHTPDLDERKYNCVTLPKQFVNDINTDPGNMSINSDQEQQLHIVQFAIEQTYLKFEKTYGEDKARRQIENAIKKYIKSGDLMGFTRQSNARQQMEQFVSKEHMLKLIIKLFAEKNHDENNRSGLEKILEDSVNETIKAHGIEHAQRALKKYITQNIDTGFTRTNGARSNLSNYSILPETAMDIIIRTVANKEIEKIKQNRTIIIDDEMYFKAEEFAAVELPDEKKKTILSRAIQWIKEKTKERLNFRGKQNQEIGSTRENKEER